MKIEDFKGLTIFKAIVPSIYAINWILMIIGPLYLHNCYHIYSTLCLVYLLCKIIIFFFTTLYVLIKSTQHLTKLQKLEYQQVKNVTDKANQISYGFVIPSYNQQIQLLSQTLGMLASHKRAKSNYLIFLAMEHHEEGSAQKALFLINKFKDSFKTINYSVHIIRLNQHRGKASNVSWCVENLQPIFKAQSINSQDVILTIMDADSWVPDLYIDVLEEKIHEQYKDRHLRIYQPIQIFTRNNLDVPMTTRVFDILHSSSHIANMWSFFDTTYSLSNYTLSYNLIKRIGFWDTCPDAIGEDMHTVLKTLWKTQMQVKTRPIYVAFNRVNIYTGKGYIADVKARFWQGERHAKGVADLPYSIKMFLLQKSIKIKSLSILWFMIQITCTQATTPWIMFSQIIYKGYIEQPIYITTIYQIISILATIYYLFYEIIKRRANKLIYKQENESLLRILEFIILSVPVLFVMALPGFIIAAFSTLLGKQQYIVAEKKSHVKQIHQKSMNQKASSLLKSQFQKQKIATIFRKID